MSPAMILGGPAEKEPTRVTVEHVDSSPSSTDRPATPQRTWQPGFWKRFPVLSFVCLCVVCGCTVASVLVIVLSSGQTQQEFCDNKLSPNVLISIFGNLAGLCIALVVGEGIAIAWWKRALTGDKVKSLHYSYSFASSLSSIITKLRWFNLIALAALAAKLTMVDSVLYQKALDSYVGYTHPQEKQLSLFASSRFPYTAIMGSSLSAPPRPLFNFMRHADLTRWVQMEQSSSEVDSLTQLINLSDCDGYNCTFPLEAAGWAVDCQEQNSTADYSKDVFETLGRIQGNSSIINTTTSFTLFDVSFGYEYPSATKNYSSIQLNITTADTSDAVSNTENGACAAVTKTLTCSLRPAIVEYTFEYTRVYATVRSQGSNQGDNQKQNQKKDTRVEYLSGLGAHCEAPEESWSCKKYDADRHQLVGTRVVRNVDVFEPWVENGYSTLLGMYQLFKDTFSASSQLYWDGNRFSVRPSGTLAWLYGSTSDDSTACNYYYLPPLDTILSQINYFSASVAIQLPLFGSYESHSGASGSPPTVQWTTPWFNFSMDQLGYRNVSAKMVSRDIIYAYRPGYLAGAVAATALCVMLILPVFYGFWELGRPVTLNPLEIAYAFQGPTFGEQSIEGSAGEILKQFGGQKIVYREVMDEGGRRFVFRHDASHR